MNDMELLRRWGSDLDPPAGAPPPSVRVRALRRTPVRRSRPAGIRWSLGLSAALALTVAAVFVWSANTRGVDGPPQKEQAGPAGPAAVSAEEVLRQAAVRVAQQSDVVPRADQFVFTERVFTGSGSTTDANDNQVPQKLEPQLRQSWDSVDGTRDGLIRGRSTTAADWTFTETVHVCRNGRIKGETMACVTVPMVRPDLPTDAAAMLEYLYTHPASKNPGGDRNAVAFGAAVDLVTRYYLTPATKAAVFEALSRLPGVALRTDVADAAGRSGAAVRMSTPTSDTKIKGELIFDPKTYAFLGTTDFAVLRQVVVNAPGEMS